jgi:hypothetical protein
MTNENSSAGPVTPGALSPARSTDPWKRIPFPSEFFGGVGVVNMGKIKSVKRFQFGGARLIAGGSRPSSAKDCKARRTGFDPNSPNLLEFHVRADKSMSEYPLIII